MHKYLSNFYTKLILTKRFIETVKYLKLNQIFHTLIGYFFNKKISLKNLPFKIKKKIYFKDANWRKENIKDKKFSFLNQTKTINKHEDWNKKNVSKLWLYNLHYFDYLNTKASRKFKIRNKNLIYKWIRENNFKIGVGWEPYPTSLRIVNWIKWLIKNNVEDKYIENSIAIQLRWLNKNKEYRLMGNHLIANAKALFFGGYFFTGNEADKWRISGQAILKKQLKEQILEDGAHFERSPMYHCIILEDLLDIQNLIISNKIIEENYLRKELSLKIRNMLYWLKQINHPDGEIPFFNDATLGIAASEKFLKKYYLMLHSNHSELLEPKCTILKESGFGIIKNKSIFTVCDIGSIKPDYMPGHSHAETLSFETSFMNKRCIVNSGVSVYGVSKKRLFERSTKSHSTIEIDNINSSDVWSGFRVGNRARVFNRNIKMINEAKYIYGEHDGYKKLQGNPIHSRLWALHDDKLEVVDHIKGNSYHKICIRYYLHPKCSIFDIRSNSLIINRSYKNGFIKIIMQWDNHFKLELKETLWNQGFNNQKQNICLLLSNNSYLPNIHKTIFKILK
mgnify:CR=1 FL=1